MRDERYKNVKNLIESGRIVAFREIFTFKAIPKTVLAKDLRMHHGTVDKFLAAPHFNYRPPRTVDVKLEDILSQLITHLRPVLDPLLGKNEVIDFFPRFASVTRNHLLHGTHVKMLNQLFKLKFLFTKRTCP